MTQTSLKNSQVFLALDAGLAAKRHYPSINWNTSFSLYDIQYNYMIANEYTDGEQFVKDRNQAKSILVRESELEELVKIVGMDGLDNKDRLMLEIAKSLREDFLQQNGFDPVDTYCEFNKMKSMLRAIISVYEKVEQALEMHMSNETYVAEIFTSELKKALSDMKYETDLDKIEEAQNKQLAKIV
jgi:V/A-type H+-transporting ATPase subunit A